MRIIVVDDDKIIRMGLIKILNKLFQIFVDKKTRLLYSECVEQRRSSNRTGEDRFLCRLRGLMSAFFVEWRECYARGTGADSVGMRHFRDYRPQWNANERRGDHPVHLPDA